MASKTLQLKVNGQNVEAEVEPAKLLLDFLRDDLGLTGTKEGCGPATAAPAPSTSTAGRSTPA